MQSEEKTEEKKEVQLPLALENDRTQREASEKPGPSAAAVESHRHALLGAVVVVIVCLTLLFYAVFFWPRLYDVATIKTGDKIYPTRINRITGAVHYFDGEAWRNTPVPAAGTPERPQAMPANVPPADRQNAPASPAMVEKKGAFAIQIKALDNWLDANTMMIELKKTGADAHFVAVPMGERGIWYRILIGHFRNSDEASAYMQANRLKDYFPDSFVQKLPQ